MTSYAETQRLPRANLSDFSAAQTEIWDHVIKTRKLAFMPNMFAVMGQSPEALRAVAAVGEHVRWHSALDNDLREMVICTVAQAVGNIYEWDHHIPQGAGAVPKSRGNALDRGGARAGGTSAPPLPPVGER